jgi:hypothetical protein
MHLQRIPQLPPNKSLQPTPDGAGRSEGLVEAAHQHREQSVVAEPADWSGAFTRPEGGHESAG